ncbi:HAAS signaling domain-containing protein [Georgenia thermotolerans]|uniref:Uncharacterized protein n=1 Tax=Georgenia thermotolerans TaxID=527326 RepID=A0A7J5UMI1_9MICO|nr:hypothetical protein [Georgenia thermotolerans]KAE8763490.1 hypothetical protein GB883_13905 [Georgenia thermotolerans]
MTAQSTVAVSVPRPPLRDRIRREAYLLRLQLWLDTYPGKQRRALVAQLRGELDAAAAATSMAEAIDGLGNPRTLAGEYLALLPRDRPRWLVGATWAAGWLVVWLLAVTTFTAALVQVADGAGPAGVEARLFWLELTVVVTDAQFSVSSQGFPGGLVLAAVLLVVGARGWRVVPALRPDQP